MTKLFRIWESDGNDRWESMRVKAEDIDAVVEWLKRTQFKPEALEKLEIDISEETLAYISWMECDPKECAEQNEMPKDEQDDWCSDCEQPSHYISVEEEENPAGWEHEFKTIYGTNEYYDLTVDPPTKAKDWDHELAKAWRKNPQDGANLLLRKTQDALAQGKNLTD